MNENAKKWVQALRSGEYKQGKGSLRVNDEFCVLGVACDLASKAGVVTQIKYHDGSYSYDSCSYIAPIGVMDMFGICSDGAKYKTAGRISITTTLTEQNDNGMSFSALADLIESEPEGLFKEHQES